MNIIEIDTSFTEPNLDYYLKTKNLKNLWWAFFFEGTP